MRVLPVLLLNLLGAVTNKSMSTEDSEKSSESEVTRIGNPFQPSNERLSVLKDCPLFHNFSPIGLNLLGNIIQDRVLGAGTYVFRSGDAAASFYIVASGEVTISMAGKTGRPVPMVTLARGASFGELGGVMSGSRMTTAVATQESRIFEIKRAKLGQLQADKPQLCVKLMLNVCEMFASRMKSAETDFQDYLSWRMGV